MINLGYGSHVTLTRLSADTVRLGVHLETAADAYYGSAVTEVMILLNEEQFQELLRQGEGLRDPINEQQQD